MKTNTISVISVRIRSVFIPRNGEESEEINEDSSGVWRRHNAALARHCGLPTTYGLHVACVTWPCRPRGSACFQTENDSVEAESACQGKFDVD
jgi:hypothetical protein